MSFDSGFGTVLCRFLHEQNDRLVNHSNHSADSLHQSRCVAQKHQHHELSELSEVLFDRVQQPVSHVRHSRNQEESADSARVFGDRHREVLFDERELLARTCGFGSRHLFPADDPKTDIKERLS